MVGADELLTAVEAAFGHTSSGLAPWPDPHPDRQPDTDEYSRVTDARKWRIIGARAEAWACAVEARGLAVVERDATARWDVEPGTLISRVDRLVPTRPGALALTIGHSAIDGALACGVTIGVGDPAVCIGWLPHCGCDACDSGSQNELDEVDRHLAGVIGGTFRRLTRGDRTITVLAGDGWSASGSYRRGEVDRILVDPRGWCELTGPAW